MARNKAAFLLMTVLALSTVTTSSPLVKRDVSSSEESEEEPEKQIKKVKDICRNSSGSDSSFKTLIEAFLDTQTCFSDFIDVDLFIQDLYTLTNETRTTVFPRHCNSLRNVYTCVKKSFKDMRPCLKEDDYNVQQAIYDLMPDAVDLMCKNDGEIFSTIEEPQFIDKFDLDCEECFSRFLNESKEWGYSHLNQDQCNKFSSHRECIQDKLNIYKVPLLMNVFDLLHNTLFRMTTCGNFVELEKLTMIPNNDIGEAYESAVLK